MNVKAITIDFWNTLYDSSNGKMRNSYRQKILIEEMDKTGRLIMHDEYDNAMKATWEYFEEVWIKQHRTPGAEECVNFIWNHLKLPDNKESLEIVIKAFEDSVLIHPPKLIEHVVETLPILAEKYPLALISDTGFSPGTILLEQMKRDGIDKYFCGFSFSDETGVSKPNAKAFHKALEFTKSEPVETLHIGDIEQTDVKGAKGLGMKAIRFSGSITEYVSVRNSDTTDADHEFNTWKEIRDLLI